MLKFIDQPKQRNVLHITKEGSSIIIGTKQLGDSGNLIDLLSPPFLLSESDSIGRYRQGVFYSQYAPETFGSSIVEFRNIQQAEHLKSKKNSIGQFGFLTIPTFVEEEVLTLFDVLSGLMF